MSGTLFLDYIWSGAQLRERKANNFLGAIRTSLTTKRKSERHVMLIELSSQQLLMKRELLFITITQH